MPSFPSGTLALIIRVLHFIFFFCSPLIRYFIWLSPPSHNVAVLPFRLFIFYASAVFLFIIGRSLVHNFFVLVIHNEVLMRKNLFVWVDVFF